MNKTLSVFLDRLAERFTALLAGVISSRVAGMHAAAQAEQQSALEDLARQYESQGKLEIAAKLRSRAAALTSADLASEALEVVGRTTAEAPRLETSDESRADNQLKGLPNLSSDSAAGTSRKKSKRQPRDGQSPDAPSLDEPGAPV